MFHIITGDGEFNPEFDSTLHKWGIKDRGFDYKVLSILGGQSGGKSTLLNHLFHTKFAVLDASKGIHQTTLGIWISPGDTKKVLVFDVEGTDSKERGEENTAFEGKTSLFSLALSEILIINVNMKDIGSLKASNYSLLKFVLELNLQLFQKSKTSKTLLLFAVRDWDSDVPAERIKQQLSKDMEGMWSSINKPSEFADSPLNKFFDVDFHLLSHFRYEKPQFLQQVEDLRSKLLTPEHPGYLWNPRYRPDVPIDGFDLYAKNIWEVIKDNRDLDLPSQKHMLAMFRCEEISSDAYERFLEAVAPFSGQLRSNELIPTFGEDLSSIIDQALGDYDKNSTWYQQDVKENTRKELLMKMKRDLNGMYLDYIGKLRAKVLGEFESKIQSVVPKEEHLVLENFAQVTRDLKNAAIENFTSLAEKATIRQAASEWRYDNDLSDLSRTIDKQILNLREHQMRRVLEKTDKTVKVQVIDPLLDVLDASQPNMWDEIRNLEGKGADGAISYLIKELESFDCSPEDIEKQSRELRARVRQTTLDTIKKRAETLYDHLMKQFSIRFQQDENGLPRKWTPDLDVPELYQQAFEGVVGLIDLFAINRLAPEHGELSSESDDVPLELIFLTKRECGQLKNRFKQASDAIFTTARSDQERNGNPTNVPLVMVALMFVLGFNEIMWVLSNPFSFFLLLIVGVGFGALWYLEMMYLVKPVANVLFRTSIESLHSVVSAKKEKTD